MASSPEDVLQHAGVGLMAGHGGGAVVEDDHQDVVLVEHGVGQAGHAGMEEGGVADEGHHRLAGGPGKAAAGGHGGAHADQEVGHAQGRQHAQGIAADVAGIAGVVTEGVADGIIDGAVRAAGTKVRRTHGQLADHGRGGLDRAGAVQIIGHAAQHQGGGVFVQHGEGLVLAFDAGLAAALLGQGAHAAFQQGLAFLQHQHAVTGVQEGFDAGLRAGARSCPARARARAFPSRRKPGRRPDSCGPHRWR